MGARHQGRRLDRGRRRSGLRQAHQRARHRDRDLRPRHADRAQRDAGRRPGEELDARRPHRPHRRGGQRRLRERRRDGARDPHRRRQGAGFGAGDPGPAGAIQPIRRLGAEIRAHLLRRRRRDGGKGAQRDEFRHPAPHARGGPAHPLSQVIRRAGRRRSNRLPARERPFLHRRAAPFRAAADRRQRADRRADAAASELDRLLRPDDRPAWARPISPACSPARWRRRRSCAASAISAPSRPSSRVGDRRRDPDAGLGARRRRGCSAAARSASSSPASMR